MLYTRVDWVDLIGILVAYVFFMSMIVFSTIALAGWYAWGIKVDIICGAIGMESVLVGDELVCEDRRGVLYRIDYILSGKKD